MLYYATFLEGFSSEQEKQLASLLFQTLSQKLETHSKKSKFTNESEKLLKQGKIFFDYDREKRLFVSERPEELKKAIIKASENLFPPECIDYFKKLTFFPSEEEAYMCSRNGLLYSTRGRTHKNSYTKRTLTFNGTVTSAFGLKKILAENAGLIIGHVHDDLSCYSKLRELLPSFKQSEVNTLYVELTCDIFLPLFKTFNNNPLSDIPAIRKELEAQKEYNDGLLYNKEQNNALYKLLLAAKKEKIAVYPCDVFSMNIVTDQSGKKIINYAHRINVGNACIIRSIEKLQSDQKHPKFIALLGLAHHTISRELNVPSCFIGDIKQDRSIETLIHQVNYVCNTQQGLAMSTNTSTSIALRFSFLSVPIKIDQSEDPTIKIILTHWGSITKEIPHFSQVTIKEAKEASKVYIQFILKKQQEYGDNISHTCAALHPLCVEKLTHAVYAKNKELLHPKNWSPFFHCQRPYGIRLLENESTAFTFINLAENHPVKLHRA